MGLCAKRDGRFAEERPVPFGVRIHFFSSSTKAKEENAGYPRRYAGCLRIDGKCTLLPARVNRLVLPQQGTILVTLMIRGIVRARIDGRRATFGRKINIRPSVNRRSVVNFASAGFTSGPA